MAAALRELKAFCDAHLDPAAIDRQADIPRDVIDGLGRLGVLGMTGAEAVGGRGFSQLAYCRVLEEFGLAVQRDVDLRQRRIIPSACGRCCCSAPTSRSGAGFPTWWPARSWPRSR